MPIRFPASQIVTDYRDLPPQPGVYFFFSPTGALLYIGKSKNLRTRVRTHLAARQGTSATLGQEFASIGYVVRAGEVDTLLYESYAIKHFRPLLNHQLRSTQPAVAVVAELNTTGYLQCRVTNFSASLPNQQVVLAVGKTKKKLQELLLHHQVTVKLCGKWLGIEKSNGSCFAYQLGECSGACVGKELPTHYNERVKEAFARSIVPAWPFLGELVVTEENQAAQLRVDHHFHDWQHLGVAESSPDSLGLYQTVATDAYFSTDVYRILKRYVDSSPQ